MKVVKSIVQLGLCSLFFTSFLNHSTELKSPIAIAIHGGAGTISKANLTPEQEQQYKDTLAQAVKAGYAVLLSGQSSIVAVKTSINILENSPLFNAGLGAVYTYEGKHELDASIMEGRNRNAGAVAAITNVKNPIDAALAVMQNSVHVMLSGTGAETFAQEQGLELVSNDYFDTPFRYEALKRARIKLEADKSAWLDPSMNDYKFGTVGTVALDKNGDLAAGTSTGGMTAKRYGRIGDAPVIGAGTFADNQSCAVSATGHGEFFIRYAVASDICARMKYSGLSLEEAANQVIFDVLAPVGGDGGVIALDAEGNIATPFNTEGMYRASIDKQGVMSVQIYKVQK